MHQLRHLVLGPALHQRSRLRIHVLVLRAVCIVLDGHGRANLYLR